MQEADVRVSISSVSRPRPMAIGLLSVAGGPSVAGAHIYDLAQALARAGHDVTLWIRRTAAGQPDTSEPAPGLRVRRLAAGPARPTTDHELVPHLPEVVAALRAAWSDERPDLVHGHSRLSGLVMVAAARGTGIHTVQSFSAGGSVHGRNQTDAGLVRHADQLIASSSEGVSRLLRLGAPRSTVAVIPSGVDTETFCPGGTADAGTGRPRLVSLSGWEPSTGVDEAVVALARVPDAELVLAGGGEERHRARLSALAERHRVHDRLQLLDGLSRERIPALLRSSDIVVCVPWFEQSSAPALEAMACGRPVVASAVGGLADTVVDGITGVHVPAREPHRLATVLRNLLGGAVLREAFGVAGRDRALARYSWDRVADATGLVYRQLVTRPARG